MNTPVLTAFALALICAGVIYGACEFFVNGVEWVGRKAGVGQTAVGTVLAAFGTALPESVVTFVAVVFHHDIAAKEIGVGAALGGPLVLGTLAYAIVGLTVLATRRRTGSARLVLNRERLGRDQGWFLSIFAVKFALGLIAFSIKPLLGFAFLATYALYVWKEIREEEDAGDHLLEPLKLRPGHADPSIGWAILQTTLALIVIFGASQLFVEQLAHIGPALGLPPTIVALLLSPIATELPEIMNAIIWIRQGKQSLALANISGSMMVQATVPSAFGLLFTPWLFDSALILAGGVTMASILGLFLLLRRDALTAKRMCWFGLFYGVFAVGLIVFQRCGVS